MSNLLNVLPGEPAKVNIEVTRNDTFIRKIVGWKADGTPYDFTGHTFKMQVKEEREDGATAIIDIPDADFTISQNTIGSNAGVNNVVTIEHAKSNMDVEPKDYVFDIELTDASGKTQTFMREKDYFRVNQDVSQ